MRRSSFKALNMSNYFYTANGNLEIIHTPGANQGPARVYPWHLHLGHWTAGRVLSGAAHLAFADQSQDYQARENFLIPPGRPHQLIVEAGSALTVLSYTDPAELLHLSSLVSPAARREAAFPAEDTLRALILFALGTHDDGCRSASKAQRVTMMAEAVFTIAARIMATPSAEFSLEEMAKYAGFSRWHFLRSFHACLGLTPHALQAQGRIRLLRAGIRDGASLAELAAATGFTDQSHMHRLFKRHHCLTPQQFRRASFKLPAAPAPSNKSLRNRFAP